jgi:cardiolipin-specific phospholipase
VGRQYLEVHKDSTPDEAAITAAVANKARENGIPVVLMYGENDWMDVGGGHDSKRRIEAEKKKVLAQASEREKQLENGDVKVTVIRKAGHHLYLEGYEQFNEEILGELKDVERRQQRLAKL